MQQPPDRPPVFPVWAVVALVVAATAGGVWWIVRSDPQIPSAPAATHVPCQPLAQTAGPSGAQAVARTKDWEITVTRAAAEDSVPAQDGGTYAAPPREVYFSVAVTFTNLHPGTESAVSTSLGRLVCSDGTERVMVGFEDGRRRGFCLVCGLDLGTDQRRVRWTLIYRVERKFLGQPFRFRYDTAPPIALSLTP